MDIEFPLDSAHTALPRPSTSVRTRPGIVGFAKLPWYFRYLVPPLSKSVSISTPLVYVT